MIRSVRVSPAKYVVAALASRDLEGMVTQVGQRHAKLTWPRPCLLRPPFLRFFVILVRPVDQLSGLVLSQARVFSIKNECASNVNKAASSPKPWMAIYLCNSMRYKTAIPRRCKAFESFISQAAATGHVPGGNAGKRAREEGFIEISACFLLSVTYTVH
jgi:hypothetical protein